MKKNFAVLYIFLTLAASGIAYAYALPGESSRTTAGSTASYDFDNSFHNLVSPFQNFFNSAKLSAAIPVSIKTGSNSSLNIAVGINVQQYVNQFNVWFYNTTGVHIEGLTTAAVSFFSWLFGLAEGVVHWIVHR